MVYMINEKTLLTFNYPYTHNIFTSVVDDGGVFSSRLSFVSWKLQSLKVPLLEIYGKLGWHARHCICIGKKTRKNPKFYFSSLECPYISLYR